MNARNERNQHKKETEDKQMAAILSINAAGQSGKKINKNIYGHFSEHLGRCIYGGVYVGEKSDIPNVNGMRTDVVQALKKIGVPVLRWPGGCFADEYHWEDGIGPKETRKRMVNTNWGGVVEDNSFGTHEFMELCRQIGCEPYVNANVGSGTVREIAEWVEYMNSTGDSTVVQKRWANGHKEPFNLKYLGVGNENWGCGGNMRPEYYADEYRRYQTFCRNYGDNKLYRIACGPSSGDWNWTDKLMERAGRYLDAITLHHYTVPHTWDKKGSATDFDADEYYLTLRNAAYMDTLIRGHLAIMDKYDHEHRVGARFLSLFDHTHGVCGVVGAGAGNHRNVDDLLDGPDQLDLLIHMGDGRFAGGAIDHQTIRAIGDEVFGELLRGGEIDAAVGLHRGDHSRQNAAERC